MKRVHKLTVSLVQPDAFQEESNHFFRGIVGDSHIIFVSYMMINSCYHHTESVAPGSLLPD